MGQGAWEEINHVEFKGKNFGWPIYEGLFHQNAYSSMLTEDRLNKNPLFGSSKESCNEYHYFQEYLIDINRSHNGQWTNNCDNQIEISEGVPKFFHERPLLSYKNTNNNTIENPVAYVPGFDQEGNSTEVEVNTKDSPVYGSGFEGFAPVSISFSEKTDFPKEYKNSIFFGDFAGFIKRVKLNDNKEVVKVTNFHTNAITPTNLRVNPYDGCLYYTSYYTPALRKICYGGNQSPVAQVDQEIYYGESPLSISFDASNSYDPDSDSLQFRWEFGDGSPIMTLPSVDHVFSVQGEDSIFNVKLTVSDTSGGMSTKNILVSLNNTPPSFDFVGFDDQDLYKNKTFILDLEADVFDNESSNDKLDYLWTIKLNHNTHYHIEKTSASKSSQVRINEIACDEETYWYTVELEVIDPAGLSTFKKADLFMDCLGLVGTSFNESNESSIRIYPNPTKDYVNIKIDGENVVNHIEIYNSKGDLIKSVASLNKIDLSSFHSGIYLVKVLTNEVVFMKKIIVQ